MSLPKKKVIRGEERYKTIFDMRVNGATNKEIAEKIGINESSLSDQLRRKTYRDFEKKQLQLAVSKIDSSLEFDTLQALKRHLAVPLPDAKVIDMALKVIGRLSSGSSGGNTTNVLSIGDAETYDKVKKRIDSYIGRLRGLGGSTSDEKQVSETPTYPQKDTI